MRFVRVPSFGDHREQGSAVVGFAYTSALLTLLFLSLLQVAFIMHTRVVLIDIAGEGARAAGRHGSSLAQGESHARELLTQVPGEHTVSSRVSSHQGFRIVEMTVQGTLPVIGAFGVSNGLSVTGRGVVESYQEVP
ncbi:hypothetical protein [Timonella senegalensis]|jgi:hypothetical protein|uniref:hypothetical protein n=1 Tax=Timonella senegalensis TaxID=1465825 RepID=UPI000594AA65|nr:hypothetical protein [Timonella senegalensis]